MRKDDRDDVVLSDLELVADADEAEFARLLLRILGAVGVLEKLPDKFVFGLAHQAFQGHVERVVVLLHKPSLRANTQARICTLTQPQTQLYGVQIQYWPKNVSQMQQLANEPLFFLNIFCTVCNLR